MPRLSASVVVGAGMLALLATACTKTPEASVVPGGDPERGKLAVQQYDCGSCHTIPGITGAHGLVGPNLSGVANRVYIAGVLPNAPENMVRWLMNPPGIDAKTAMPYLGLTERDARDIGEYLYRSFR